MLHKATVDASGFVGGVVTPARAAGIGVPDGPGAALASLRVRSRVII